MKLRQKTTWVLTGIAALLSAAVRADPTIMTNRVEIDTSGQASLGLKSTPNGHLWNLQTGATVVCQLHQPCLPPPAVQKRLAESFLINDQTANAARFWIGGDGKVGINTTNPSQALEVNGPGDAQIALRSSDSSNRTWTIQSSSGVNNGNLNQTFQIVDRTAQKARLIIDTAGTVSVGVLTITGGSDVAEPFPTTSHDVEAGSVLVIDDTNPGHLKVSDRAYDRRVAGIISGANGIKPGLSLRQQDLLEGGPNVALVGRVYALADATHAPIEPGDLLTTSQTPGRCMKATNDKRAHGAILGKAMSSLHSGKGMILVLVSLQ